MVRAREHAGKPKPMQPGQSKDFARLADAALVQGNAPLARDPSLDIYTAPTYDAVHLDIWSRPHPVCDLGLLLG